MTDLPFCCPDCSKTYKTERGLMAHVQNKHDWTLDFYRDWVLRTPETVTPEEVTSGGSVASAKENPLDSPAGNTEVGDSAFFESSPADTGESGLTVGSSPTAAQPEGMDEDATSSSPTIDQYLAGIDQAIRQLDENQKVQQTTIIELQKNQYEALTPAEGPVAPTWSFDEFPEWLKEPAIKFLGDIGAAARSLAGGQPDVPPEDEQVLRAVIKMSREEQAQRVMARAQQIKDAMTDPNLELFMKEVPGGTSKEDGKDG